MDVIFISTGVFYKQVFFQLTVKINFCDCRALSYLSVCVCVTEICKGKA